MTIASLSLVVACSIGHSDESQSRYFEQLRQRGLFSLAESEAISRLASTRLPLADRTNFSIELSRTLTEHAGFVSDEQRDELWQQGRSVIEDLLTREKSNPRSILLEGQLASVSVTEGNWLRAESLLRPFDEPLRDQARNASTKAVDRLQSIEKRLADPPRESNPKKPAVGATTGHEIRSLLHQVRWQLGQSFCSLAELAPAESPERTANAISAEQSLRKLIGVADEPLQSRAKLLLVTCSRLKGDLDRASEMLTALEKTEPRPIDPVLDEMTAEHVRLLMELKRPTEAAELLMKTRGKRQRLSGELWFLQTRVLIALRDITLEKQQETLAERLGEQVATTVDRCEQQVGGYWSRRCRQLWDNAQTSRKYGPELDSLMQQARMSFTAGRIDAAVAQYRSAEKVARTNGQSELAMELGFTSASILLDQKQHETAAAEFLRLATEYPLQERAAKAHLLGAYALGRFYDEKRTQQRREAYRNELDLHLTNFPRDTTVNEARFLKAQLEEQRLQSTLALPLYLEVETGHVRAAEAISGAARCYETILRRMKERSLPTADFEREATNRLKTYLSPTGESVETWTDTHADVALRLVSLLLMASSDNTPQDEADGGQIAVPEKRLVQKTLPNPIKQASQWLERVAAYLEHRSAEPESAAIVASLRQRMIPLRIVVLAGSGSLAESEKLLQSLPPSPAILSTIVDELRQLASTKQPQAQAPIAVLQLKVAEQLLPLRKQLSPAQQAQLDHNLVAALIQTGQLPKAIERMKTMAEQSAKDVDRQRALAKHLTELKQPEAELLARQCWRRVESLTKPGSTEWMSARLEALRCCFRLNEFDEGRKLFQVTKVLYPELGGELLSEQFSAIERDLKASKAPSK